MDALNFKGNKMIKSEIFEQAITNRMKVRFYYNLNEEVLDPYFIFIEEDGTKALYGRSNLGRKMKKFDFEKIANIRILPSESFIPNIPLSPIYN